VFEYIDQQPTATTFVTAEAALSEHPEVVALRAAQELAGTYGTSDGIKAMRELYERLRQNQ
jgi:hypothetical protein